MTPWDGVHPVAFGLDRLGLNPFWDAEKGDTTEVPERMDTEIMGVVSGVGAESTELRITIRRIEHLTRHVEGSDEVQAVTRSDAVYERETYEALFGAIRFEVERILAVRSLGVAPTSPGGPP